MTKKVTSPGPKPVRPPQTHSRQTQQPQQQAPARRGRGPAPLPAQSRARGVRTTNSQSRQQGAPFVPGTIRNGGQPQLPAFPTSPSFSGPRYQTQPTSPGQGFAGSGQRPNRTMSQVVGPNGISQNMGGAGTPGQTGRQRGMTQSIGPDGTIYQHMNGMTQVVQPGRQQGAGGQFRPQFQPYSQPFQTVEPPLAGSAGGTQGLRPVPDPMFSPPGGSTGQGGAQPGSLVPPVPLTIPQRMPGVEELPSPLPMGGTGAQLPRPTAGAGRPAAPATGYRPDNGQAFVPPGGNAPVHADLSDRRGITGNAQLPAGSHLTLDNLAANPGLRIDGGGAGSLVNFRQPYSMMDPVSADGSVDEAAKRQGWRTFAPSPLPEKWDPKNGIQLRGFPRFTLPDVPDAMDFPPTQ